MWIAGGLRLYGSHEAPWRERWKIAAAEAAAMSAMMVWFLLFFEKKRGNEWIFLRNGGNDFCSQEVKVGI